MREILSGSSGRSVRLGSFSCDNRYLVVVVGPVVVVGVGHISRKRLEQEVAGQSSNIQKLSLIILTIDLNLVETINISWMTQLSIECIRDGSDLGKKFGWQSDVKGNRAICLEEEERQRAISCPTRPNHAPLSTTLPAFLCTGH